MNKQLAVVVCVLAVTGLNDASERYPVATSSLGKFVIALSQPGAMKDMSALFGEEAAETATSCPMGRAGLACRRAEARRGVESCPNGACNACDMCAGANSVVLWPNCCKHNGVCCAQLARSCQACDQPDLHNFCRKHFKRCY